MPTFGQNAANISSIIYSNNSLVEADINTSRYKLFAKFEELPLIDEISSKKFTVSASTQDAVFLEDGAFGRALRMKPLTTLQYGLGISSVTTFSMGFWLNPVNIIPTVNSQTGLPNYYRMGLIDKANYQLNGSSGIIEIIEGQTAFSISEECREDGKNRMRILLNMPAGSVVYETSEYTSGEWHFFWVAFSGPAQTIKVFIDGIEDTGLTQVSGSASLGSLVQTSTPLRINNSAHGFNSLIRGNYGLLDELIYETGFTTSPEIIGRHINLGSEFVVNETLLNLEEVYHAFAYDDPTTIDISSVYSNGKNIYAGRSDGRVFRGDRTMWRARRDFANKDEIRFIKSKVLASDSIVDFEDGALKLVKATARI
tara:strand:+ start:331142 stop:332248 length:1107 start_codon:yes stop_codon:yes gene_type:complete